MMSDNLQEFLKEAGPTVDRLLENMRRLHVEKFQFTRPSGRVTLWCYEAPPSSVSSVSEDTFNINLKIDPKAEIANASPITTTTNPIIVAGNKGGLNIPLKRTVQKDAVKPKADPTPEAAAAPPVSGNGARPPKTPVINKYDPNILIKTALAASTGDGVYVLRPKAPAACKKKMPLKGVTTQRRISTIPYDAAATFYDYDSTVASSSSEGACAPPESRDDFFDKSQYSYMDNTPKTQREAKRGYMFVR